MSKGARVAVVGATGLVGETAIRVLEERGFALEQLFPLASNRSLGRSVEFRGRSLPVLELAGFDFSRADIALFSADAAVSGEFAPQAVSAGCIVIDSSARFRYEEDVPLVVPEVNAHAIAQYSSRGIIATPNGTTIQLVVALKPLHAAAGIERINVATYQAVSGAGREAVEELAAQAANLLSGRPAGEARVIPGQIAFNCVPQTDGFEDNGYTREELQMAWETRRLLEDPAVRVNVTAVRVPVFYGHSEAVHIETRRKVSAVEARTLLQQAPGVQVLDERRPGGYPTAVTEAANHDTVYVGRIREDMSHERGLDLWIVSDNVRKGAATNSVQIAEVLVRDYL